MNMKKILVVLLTLTMLTSAFAPTLGVFAAELQNVDEAPEETKINYVSLGDSMANGYGFEGYKQWEEGHDFFAEGNVGTYGEGAYPLQFEEYLKGIYGEDNVDHTELALSAMTPEFLLYLLGGRDRADNDWHDGVMDYASDENGAVDKEEMAEKMSEYFQEAIADADIITYGVGNGNLGAFLLSEVSSAIGVMGGSPDPDPRYTLENALVIVENEREKELVLSVYNSVMEDLMANISEEMAAQYNVEAIAGIFAYSAAGIVFNYSRILEKIDEINQKDNLDIIIVALMNTTYGMKVDLGNGEVFDFGGTMDEVFNLMNAYLSMYPAVMKTMGEFESISFTYAKQPQPKFILQAFDELQAAGWTNVDCGAEDCYTEGHVCADGEGRLSADIVRARTIKTYNGSLRGMISSAMGMNLSEITLDDVKAWKSWDEVKIIYAEYIANLQILSGTISETDKENFIEGFISTITDDDMITAFPFMRPDILLPNESFVDNLDFTTEDCLIKENKEASINLTTSVAIYLAIEDAIVNSIDVKEYTVEELMKIADVSKLMTVFDGIDREESDKSPYHVRQVIGNHLSKDDILPLVNIYAIFQIGDGMCVHPTPAGHDDITASIIEAYESGKSVDIDDVVEIFDNYKEIIYKYAYEYVKAEGYIQPYADALEDALDALEIARAEVEKLVVGQYGLTAELKEKTLAELDAAIATLTKIKTAIDDDTIGTLEGLNETLLDLQGDLDTHIANAIAIFEQANADLEALVVPALEEAQRCLKEEIIPAFYVMAKDGAYAAVDYLLTNIDYIYYNFPEIANTAYTEALKALAAAQIIVADVIDVASEIILDAWNDAYALGLHIYEKAPEAYAFAYETIEMVIGTLIAINENTDGALEDLFAETFGITVQEALKLAEDLYFRVYGDVEAALLELNAILMDVAATAEENLPAAIELYGVIVDVLVDSYENADDAVLVAGQIFSYVYDFAVENDMGANLKGHLDNIVDLIAETYRGTKDINAVGAEIYAYAVSMFDDTFAADYEVNKDSIYVSLGNAVYGEELAELIYLGDKYYNFGLDEDYLETLADADFVTIRIDNGEVLEFVMAQITDPTELDWDKHLDAEGQIALANILADLESALLTTGAADEIANAISLAIDEYLGGSAIIGVTIDAELVAEVLPYVIEGAIYAYADSISRLETVLDNVYETAPDATVVITGIQNPIDTFDLSGFGLDLGEYAKYLEPALAVFNAQLVAVAYANDNTIFVNSIDADDIYAALTVTCAHDYDDCEDDTCNICGETRVAPGHTYGNYVSNGDAKCEVDGTETATCSVCGHKDTRADEGSALEHKYGDWVEVRPATKKADGYRERTCELCGHVQGEMIPILPRGPWGWIIGGSVVVLASVAGVLYYRKKKANPTEPEKK